MECRGFFWRHYYLTAIVVQAERDPEEEGDYMAFEQLMAEAATKKRKEEKKKKKEEKKKSFFGGGGEERGTES